MKRKPEDEVNRLSMQEMFAFCAIVGICLITAGTFGEDITEFPSIYKFMLFTGLLILVYPVAVRQFFERHIDKREKRKQEMKIQRMTLKPGDKCPPPEPVHKDDMCVQPMPVNTGQGKVTHVRCTTVQNLSKASEINDILIENARQIKRQEEEALKIATKEAKKAFKDQRVSYKKMKEWFENLDFPVKVLTDKSRLKPVNIQGLIRYNDNVQAICFPSLKEQGTGYELYRIDTVGPDQYKLKVSQGSGATEPNDIRVDYKLATELLMELLPQIIEVDDEKEDE